MKRAYGNTSGRANFISSCCASKPIIGTFATPFGTSRCITGQRRAAAMRRRRQSGFTQCGNPTAASNGSSNTLSLYAYEPDRSTSFSCDHARTASRFPRDHTYVPSSSPVYTPSLSTPYVVAITASNPMRSANGSIRSRGVVVASTTLRPSARCESITFCA